MWLVLGIIRKVAKCRNLFGKEHHDCPGAEPCRKTMNLSSEPCNISHWLRLEATVKASVYVVTFSFATPITIITIVSQDLKLGRQVRYTPLCPSLLRLSSYCALGIIFQGTRSLLANSPLLICWVVFGAQLSFGERILFTLALVALNTYLAICWPLKSLPFVD